MLTFSDLGIAEKTQSRYATICPECNHTRQKHKNATCLTVNNEPNNRWYKCWHCGFSGNLDVQDKYDGIAKKAKIPTQQRAFGLKAKEYWQKAGISTATLKAFNIYESTAFGKVQMNFPFYMHRILTNVKILNLEWKSGDDFPKWYQLPLKKETDGERRILPFGINLIKTHDENGNVIPNLTLTITEGEKDCLTWFECKKTNVISVPQGAPSLKAKDFKKEFAWLNDPYVKSVFEHVKCFYLSVDADEPGKILGEHLAMILGKDKCRIIQYPSGYKDINEVLVGNEKKKLKALGKEGVEECYKNLASIPIAGIVKVASVYDKLMEIRKTGFTPGFGCGVPEVDYLFTIKRKLITFVTGVPGSGKSVWIRWWMTQMIINNVEMDFKWAMFTPENRPVEREYAKIMEVFTGQTFQADKHNSMSDEAMRKAMRWCQKHIFIISPDRLNYESFDNTVDARRVNTLGSILKYVTYLKKTENIFGYIIDAWNKIEHEQPKGQTETQFISQQLDRLIDFQAYWDVAGVVIVHPKKIEMVGENYKMPSLYDIKGSSAWKEKADIGILVHRYKMRKMTDAEAMDAGVNLNTCDEDEKWMVMQKAPTIIRTEKIKFEETGHEARVKMEMKAYGQFHVVKQNGARELPPPEETKKRIPKQKEIELPDARISSDKNDDFDIDGDAPF